MTLRVHPDDIVRESLSRLLSKHPTWERIRLGAVAEILNGFAFKSDQFNSHGEGMPLVRIRDVGRSSTHTWYSGEFDKHYVVHTGDLLVGMDGEFRAARWLGPPALLNQRVCRITVNRTDIFSGRFLDFVLPGYLQEIQRRTSSLTVRHLSSRTLTEIPLPLPPRAEQGRIVAAIEEQVSRLDTAEQLLRSALQRRDVLYRSFMRTLEEWPLVPLATLLEKPLANGRSVPTAENGSGFPVLRLTALRDGFVDLSERKLGAWGRREAERYIVQEGDFLIARGNGSLALVGRGGLVTADPDGVAYPDTMIRARVDQKQMSPEFLRWVWSSSGVRRQIESAAKTVASGPRCK